MYLSIHPFTFLPACLHVCLSVCSTRSTGTLMSSSCKTARCLYVCLPILSPFCLPACMPVCQSVQSALLGPWCFRYARLPGVFLSVCLSVYLSFHLLIRLSVCRSVCLSSPLYKNLKVLLVKVLIMSLSLPDVCPALIVHGPWRFLVEDFKCLFAIRLSVSEKSRIASQFACLIVPWRHTKLPLCRICEDAQRERHV